MEKKVNEVVEEIKVSEESLKSLTDTIAKSLDTKIEEKFAEMQKTEKTVKKELGEAPTILKNAHNPEKEGKEVRFAKQVLALANGDRALLKDYNSFALDMRTKAGYANTGNNADGGYVVADPELEAEIEALAEEYGVAFAEADVRTIGRNAVKTNKRGSNVVMYETAEGATKTASKLSIEQILKELRKFAGIAIATDELTEDSAIDFWADVRLGFAEEMARIADEMVFTDTKVGDEGLLKVGGTIIETVGANITSITWDDLLNAEASVPTASARNGKHYMHRTVWNKVKQSKDSEGRYQAVPTAGLQTPWGTPVVLVDSLPSVTMVGDGNEGYTVFGDLRRVRLYRKRGLDFYVSRDAYLADAESSNVSLFADDMTALRAVVRMMHVIKFPEAFCVTGTGTVS